MAKVDSIQSSFSGGEFGPQLYGRTDLAQYQNACEIVENFLIRPYGSAISSPGTKYVATVSDSSLRTRLIKFVFNRSDAYVIEAGAYYMRFFTNRGQIGQQAGTEDLSAFTANLISHWKLNDDAANTTVLDAVGSHSGTSSTLTSTLSTVGIVGDCFNLNGQYSVRVHDHADFTRTVSTQPMTILAWAYYASNGDEQVIFSKWNEGGAQEYILRTNSSGRLEFTLRDNANSGTKTWRAPSTLSDGWNFTAIVFAGDGNSQSDCAMYIDEVAIATEYTGTGTFVKMENTNAEVGIGAKSVQATAEKIWNNKIDNVAFIHQALTSTEIGTLYSGSVYSIETVYAENELFDIHYTQLNDVIWTAHGSHPPQQLTRVSATEWTIADFDFVGGPFLDENTDTTILMTPSATTGTINVTVSPTNSSLFTLSGSTLGHHNAYWMIGGLSQTNSTTGLQEAGYVQITHVINSYTATATVIKSLKSSAATAVWAEGAWSAVRGYPSRVIFHDGRLWFGRTNYEPQKIWGSKIFEYDNYALDTQDDDDALNLALASNESNELQWLASTKNLLSGTFGGGFVVSSGADNLAITPDNVIADEEIGIGSASIQPKRIGNFLYFLQRFKKTLRELFYLWDLNSYKAVDRTILSPHILGDGVIDMDVQNDPDPILTCVRTDGTLALLTREADQEFAAWSRQSTDGTYTSIAIIPSQVSDYDEAWVIVERWINGAQRKYVEYFENLDPPARQEDCLYLHSALTYSAYQSTSTSNVTVSLSATSGSITVTISTGYFKAADANRRVRAIDDQGVVLGEGVITAFGSTTSVTVSITTVFSALTYTPGKWGKSVVSVFGLDHLDAKTVGILADGVTESLTKTVASGTVTLGTNYFKVHVGLSYDQIIYTLPREAGAQRGTAQGKLQRISELAFKVNRSYLGFQYGTDADNLDTVTDVDTTLTQSLTTGIIGNFPFRGGYQRGTKIYIKNSKPLPIEMLNIISTVDTQEK